jgi:hypothetical protein
MAVKYWYVTGNGSSNWGTSGVASTVWFLGPGGTGGTTTVPTAVDDVVLDSSSGTGTLTISATVACRSLNSSTFNGTLTSAGNYAINITNTGTGDILNLGGTHNVPLGGISFLGNSSGNVTFNGRIHGITGGGGLIINTTGGIITFTDLAVFGGPLVLTQGSIIGTSLSVSTVNSSNANVRSFSFTNFYLTGIGGLFNTVTTQTNLTWSCTNMYLTNSTANAKNCNLSGVVSATNVYLAGSGTGPMTVSNTTSVITPNVYITNSGGSNISFGTSAVLNTVEFVTGTNAIFNNTNPITTNGNLTLCSSMTLTSSSNIVMTSTGSLTSFGKTFTGNFTTSGIITFVDDFRCSATLTLTSNTLTVNGNVTALAFASSNTNVRTLNMGNGLWTLTGFSTPWGITTSTSMTLNAQGSTIKFTDNSVNALAFNGGGLTYNNIWFDRVIGGGTISISGVNNTFNVFRISTCTVAYSLSITQSHNQNFAEFIVNGSPGALVTIVKTGGSATTFTKTTPGVISCNYINGANVSAQPDNTWYVGPYSTGSFVALWKQTTPTQRQLSSLGAG